MTKFYVHSLDRRDFVVADEPMTAAKEFVLRLTKDDVIGPYIRISPLGFLPHEDDFVFDTDYVMKEAGYEFDDEQD